MKVNQLAWFTRREAADDHESSEAIGNMKTGKAGARGNTTALPSTTQTMCLSLPSWVMFAQRKSIPDDAG
ncbi:MAG TPA: hypothetical protein VKP13_10320 [Nitrospira sp.]|nr:hypothetical protein [Nitrospira sp.]